MTRYLSLGELFALAEMVTGIDAAMLVMVSLAELADSALHAPQAGFGDDDFYPRSDRQGGGARVPARAGVGHGPLTV